MNIRVISDGADGHRLFSPENDLVGWVRGRVIGVHGFATQRAAIDAAVNAYRVLSPWLERQRLQPLPPIGSGATRLVHDGAYQWIQCDRLPVARLPGATPNPRADPARHSFEIVLHGTVSEGMAIHAALIAVRAAHGRIVSAAIGWRRRGAHAAGTIPTAATTRPNLED